MHVVTFDYEKCNGCGECARDCIWSLIEMRDDRPRVIEGGAGTCIGCQHCLAVCKPGAVRVDDVDPADRTPLRGNLPSLEQMETLAGGRRSVRRYKDEDMDPALLARLLAATANAPTGVNEMSTLLTVVDSRAAMDRVRTATYAGLRRAVEENRVPERLAWVARFLKGWEERGEDGIYRGAPHLVVASVPASAHTPEADPIIALSYFELLAASAGVGTVWAGLAYWLLTRIAPELPGMLGIPEDHAIGYAMAFGMPAVRYHRTVSRRGAAVHRANLA
ncbi:MAG: nitroreductase family protein [Desulfovibrionaceae bacterium]|jgi:nitroreductase/NAD-dependent dihydropyrimidine dehydrogenase PreA subunit|nr:nitroreductase family protein [Desulfovibrionaceae bacterium]